MNKTRAAAGLAPLSQPSSKLFAAKIGDLTAYAVCAGRKGIAAARKKFVSISGGLDVTRPGERIEIDEWRVPLQTLIVDAGVWELLTLELQEKVARERWWLSVAIDCASRCILGMRLAPTANSTSAIAVLAMVCANKRRFADAVGALTPWDMRCGFETVATDQGSAYIGDEFRAALVGAGGTPFNPPAGLAEMRARVERIFGTIHTQLISRFTGRSFENTVVLGDYPSEARASLTIDELASVLVRYVTDIYHNLPHEGLNDETPRNAWFRLTKLYNTPPPPDADTRRNIFGVKLTRALTTRGVRFLNVFYQSHDLQAYRRKVGDVEVEHHDRPRRPRLGVGADRHRWPADRPLHAADAGQVSRRLDRRLRGAAAALRRSGGDRRADRAEGDRRHRGDRRQRGATDQHRLDDAYPRRARPRRAHARHHLVAAGQLAGRAGRRQQPCRPVRRRDQAEHSRGSARGHPAVDAHAASAEAQVDDGGLRQMDDDTDIMRRLAATLTDKDSVRLEIMERVRAKYISSDRDVELEKAVDHLIERTIWAAPIPACRPRRLSGPKRAPWRWSATAARARQPRLSGCSPAIPHSPVSAQPGCALISVTRLGLVHANDRSAGSFWKNSDTSCRLTDANTWFWRWSSAGSTSQNVRFLHVDEIQNITTTANVREAVRIRNWLKTFLNNKKKPIGLILTGLPEVADFIQADTQIRRRTRFLEFQPLTRSDLEAALDTLIDFAAVAHLSVDPTAKNILVPRLLHAADYEMGTMIELIHELIDQALQSDARTLTATQFATVYAQRTGSAASANPFVAHDWHNVDCAVVLDQGPAEPTPGQ